MSPLLRSSFRLFAGAIPALSLACTLLAHAAGEDVAAPAAAVGAMPISAASSVTPPANYIFVAPLPTNKNVSSSSDSASADALPDAPQPASGAGTPGAFTPSGSTGGIVSKYSLSVPSGFTAPRMSAGDKVVAGIRNLASPISLAGTVISAGYSHLTDGQPNYGVDGDAFAMRFGAGVARSASQDIFTNSILAPVLHQDPRYYVLGSNAGFFHRVIYAATRPLITRTDSGRSTINASLLIGYAGAAALTRTYYPQINRNFHDEASTYGASIGGAAIGFGFTEFSDQLLKAVHMKH